MVVKNTLLLNEETKGQYLPSGTFKGLKIMANKYSKKAEKKISKVMKEFDEGKLHSGSKKGPIVKNPKQAIAIGISEARRKGLKAGKKK